MTRFTPLKSFLFLIVLILISCGDQTEIPPIIDTDLNHETLIKQLEENYTQLPEEQITVSSDSTVYAQYAMPTDKYGHSILGDNIEAEQLVVVVNGKFYEFLLGDEYVFEDIRPRLYDVDNDNNLEIITIRTHVSNGAGVVIYKLENEVLTEYAHIEEIGTMFRWLNIATIGDMDNDGIVEIIWVQTPHIGGILKAAKIESGTLEVLSSKSQFSNHAIGERNLCLSVVTEDSNQKVLYVPGQNRNSINGFTLTNNTLTEFEVIEQAVDFSQSLHSQFNFENTIEDEVNCIQ